jgi:hypothetical protein
MGLSVGREVRGYLSCVVAKFSDWLWGSFDIGVGGDLFFTKIMYVVDCWMAGKFVVRCSSGLEFLGAQGCRPMYLVLAG